MFYKMWKATFSVVSSSEVSDTAKVDTFIM